MSEFTEMTEESQPWVVLENPEHMAIPGTGSIRALQAIDKILDLPT